MEKITSKDNQYLKICRAMPLKKGRQRYGCYLVEGVRLAEEALFARARIRFALFQAERSAEPRIARLIQRMEKEKIPMASVPETLFHSAAATENPQGVMLLLALPEEKPLPKVAGACYAYADGVRDPGNLGTILRTAFAAGVKGLLLSPDSADLYNPKVVRSSMGAIFRLPVFTCASREEALGIMQSLQAEILVAAMDGKDVRALTPVLRKTHVWILGSEAQGAAAFWREQATGIVSLPMTAEAESLNVASAAAVLFYQSLFARE